MNKKIVVTSVVLIILSIIFGAFGAHALKDALIDYPEKIASFETGVRYQMYMAVSLLMLGLSADKFLFSLKTIFRFVLVGVILFSGSIYFLALQPLLGLKLSFLGPVTPLGGLLLIVGWMSLLYSLLTKNNNNTNPV